MTPRDKVRELAKDIAQECRTADYERKADEIEETLRAFLAERGERTQAARDRAALEAIENQADGDRAHAELVQERQARRRAEAHLHRALAEAAGLREAIAKVRMYEPPDQVRARILRALASSPLSEKAGAVLEAASSDQDWETVADAVEALRAELGREGGEGG